MLGGVEEEEYDSTVALRLLEAKTEYHQAHHQTVSVDSSEQFH
jgi:hypothetical protein